MTNDSYLIYNFQSEFDPIERKKVIKQICNADGGHSIYELSGVSFLYTKKCICLHWKQLFVPTDFSENAFHALILRVDLAKTNNAIIHLFNVYHIPNPLKTLPLEIIITPGRIESQFWFNAKANKSASERSSSESGP